MAIINLINNEAFLLYRQGASRLSFSTDAAAAITSTVTSSADNYGGVVAAAVFTNGDYVTIANGNPAGTGPWWNQVTSGSGTVNIGLSYPSVKTSVTAQAITKWERFDTRFMPSKVTLKNLSTLDMYEWTNLMGVQQVIKTAASGARTSITGDTIWVTPNAFAIHPNLLPISNNYLIELGYEYN